jgi:hypothetical protein
MISYSKLLDIVCVTLSNVFAADLSLKITLHGVKAISKLVEKNKAYVPAKLISTLLSLNIKVHFNKNLLFVLGILDITYR